MFKKKMAWLLVLVMVGASLAGCSQPAEEAAPEKVLVWNIGSEPKTIDPGLNAASDGGDVINQLFEGLMREVGGSLEPGMAESYTISDDKLVYTFVLRDAKWSDGEPVTAYDFEYSWARVLDPETASEYSWIFDEARVASFKALDEKTFEVTLSDPAPYFLGLTGFFTFMPVREDAVTQGSDGSWAINPEVALANGPFKLAEYKTGDRLVLEKNENYWRADEVKIDKIEGLMIVDLTTSLTAFESGEIHVIDAMPAEELPRLMAEDDRFYVLPMDGVYYYAFNVEVEPLDNPLVRKALSYAIDREAIVDVLNGGQIPATNMVSPASYDDKGNVFSEATGDFTPVGSEGIEEAQALLAEAGYPGGEGFPELELLYNTNDDHKMIAEIMQEMWKNNLGIKVTLANQEWAVFQDTRREGGFEMARGGWIGDYSDPMTYLGMFISESPMNYSRWKSPEYDALLDEAKTSEPAKRFELLYEAHRLMMADHAYMPVYIYTDPMMVSEAVTGWEKTTRNVFFFGFADIQ